jgi:hypothetical protein
MMRAQQAGLEHRCWLARGTRHLSLHASHYMPGLDGSTARVDVHSLTAPEVSFEVPRPSSLVGVEPPA